MDRLKLYRILTTDLNLPGDKAVDFISALGESEDKKPDTSIQTHTTRLDLNLMTDAKIKMLATKSDLNLLTERTLERFKLDFYILLFLIGLLQYFVITCSIMAILKFMR